MKLLKILLWLLGGVVVLLLAAVIIVTQFIDPNDYKQTIADAVQKQTGRTLNIEGNIRLAFWPTLGLNLGKLQISNATGFEPAEFAAIDSAQIQVKTLPLLQGQVEVGTLVFDGMRLNLARDEQGRFNWDDILERLKNGQSETPAKPPTKEGEPAIKSLNIEGVELRNTSLVWDDRMSGQALALDNLNLTTSGLSMDMHAPVDIALSGNVQLTGQQNIQGDFALNAQINAVLAQQQFHVSPLQLTVNLNGDSLPGGTQQAVIGAADIQLDLQQQSLNVQQLALNWLAQLTAKTSFTLRGFQGQNPDLTAQLRIQPFVLRDFLNKLAIALPPTVPSTLLQQAAFSTDIQASFVDGIYLNDLTLTVDEERLHTPQLHIDFIKQIADVDELSLNALGAELLVRLNAKDILSQPAINGSLHLSKLNPRAVMEKIGQPLPELSPVLPLKQVSLDTELNGNFTDGIRLQNLFAQVDEHTMDLPLLHVDFIKQTAEISGLNLQALGTSLQATLKAQNLLTQPVFNGQFSLAEFNPRELLNRLKIPLPTMQNDQALGRLALQTHLAGTWPRINLSDIKLQLDQSLMQGSADVTLGSALPVTRFDLSVDRLNVDHYLPPPVSDAKISQAKPPAEESIAVPVSFLQQLDVAGTLRVADLTVAKLQMNDISLNLTAKQGEVRLDPVMKLYGGKYLGQLRLNANVEPPLLYQQHALTEVQAGDLLSVLMVKPPITGTTSLQTRLEVPLTTPGQLQHDLSGTLDVYFSDGMIYGINFGQTLRQIAVVLGKNEEKTKETDDVLQTDFSSLSGAFQINNGILQTKQLALKSPLLRINGSGQIDLARQLLALRLDTAIVNSLEGQGGRALDELRGLVIPINIGGTFTAPNIQPDLAALLAEQAQTKAADLVDQHLENLFQDLFR